MLDGACDRLGPKHVMAETRTVASPALVARVRALDREHGTARAAALLGVGRETIARLLAGLGVRRGTIALVEAALEKIAA